MYKRRKRLTVDLTIKLPLEVIAICEHVAAISGLTVSDVINVVMATYVVKAPCNALGKT